MSQIASDVGTSLASEPTGNDASGGSRATERENTTAQAIEQAIDNTPLHNMGDYYQSAYLSALYSLSSLNPGVIPSELNPSLGIPHTLPHPQTAFQRSMTSHYQLPYNPYLYPAYPGVVSPPYAEQYFPLQQSAVSLSQGSGLGNRDYGEGSRTGALEDLSSWYYQWDHTPDSNMNDLYVRWERIVELFVKDFREINCDSAATAKIHLDMSGISVDGARDKWANILIFDCLMTFVVQKDRLKQEFGRRRFNQYHALANSVCVACGEAWVESQIPNFAGIFPDESFLMASEHSSGDNIHASAAAASFLTSTKRQEPASKSVTGRRKGISTDRADKAASQSSVDDSHHITLKRVRSQFEGSIRVQADTIESIRKGVNSNIVRHAPVESNASASTSDMTTSHSLYTSNSDGSALDTALSNQSQENAMPPRVRVIDIGPPWNSLHSLRAQFLQGMNSTYAKRKRVVSILIDDFPHSRSPSATTDIINEVVNDIYCQHFLLDSARKRAAKSASRKPGANLLGIDAEINLAGVKEFLTIARRLQDPMISNDKSSSTDQVSSRRRCQGIFDNSSSATRPDENQ